MKYVKRYNKFNFQTNCRVCLTQSVSSKISLTDPLRGDKSPKPLVFEALQVITKHTVPMNAKYPQSICGMCLELLKIAYDLVLQYQRSQSYLKEKFEDFDDGDVIEEPLERTSDKKHGEKDSKVAPVEIYVGRAKFDLKELLIVEDENQENLAYDGFLRNLGTTVSATIVKKGREKQRPKPGIPSVVIEKIIQDYTPEESDTADLIQITVGDADEPIEIRPAIGNEMADFLEEPCNTDIFKNLSDLNKRDKEVVDSALNMKFKCPHCLKPLSSLTRVKNHTKKCDKNTLNSTCHVCDTKLKSRRQLLLHIKEKHLDALKKNPRLKSAINSAFTCRICGETLKSNGNLFYHLSKHKGKRYSCSVCDKLFYTKSQVRNHSLIHNRTAQVVCPICGKTFHYRSGLHYHMKMHLNERNLQCSYCPRRFYTRNSLKRHELTHTGARPFPCDYCEKCFRSMGEKRKHELLHTGERPYSCKYCEMGFSQTHNLKMHMLTHSGSFSCTHCFKTFADNDILKFHLKNKHRITDTIGDPLELSEDVLQELVEESEDVLQEFAEEEEEQQIEEFEPSEGIQLESVFVSEQFEDVTEDDSNVYVQTYELEDEDLLVETLESVGGLD